MKNLIVGLEIYFKDLNLEKQKELLKKDVNLYIEEVCLSNNPCLIEWVLLNCFLDNKVQNQLIRNYLELETEENIKDFFKKNPEFKYDDETLKAFIYSNSSFLHRLVTDYSETSNDFLVELINSHTNMSTVINVFNHSNFILSIDNLEKLNIEKILEVSSNFAAIRFLSCKDVSNEFLNKTVQILANENSNNSDPICRILKHPIFILAPETRDALIHCPSSIVRERIAKFSTRSEFLNSMFQYEIQFLGNPYVLTAITKNSCFEMDNTSKNVLYEVNSKEVVITAYQKEKLLDYLRGFCPEISSINIDKILKIICEKPIK